MLLLALMLLLPPDQKTDLRAIDELHRKDQAATKAYDVAALTALWTDDVIAFPPNGQPIVGKKANTDNLNAGLEQSKLMDILDYNQKWEEVTIAGDYAYEWGTFYSMVALRSTAQTTKAEFKVMRVLKRQPDGNWKVHRSMWNEIPPAQPGFVEAVPSQTAPPPAAKKP